MKTSDSVLLKGSQGASALIDKLHGMEDSESVMEVLRQLRFAALSINLAGRQRMLLQKVCKEFYMVLAGVDPVSSRRLMRKSLSAFENSLSVLIKNVEKGVLSDEMSSRLLGALRGVEGKWGDFSGVLRKVSDSLEVPSRKEISYVNVCNGEILLELERLVEVYENLAYQLHP